MADIDELQIKIAADSQSASENVLALAGSLESLATSAIVATEPLKNFSQALNNLKGFKATGITQTADDLSKAFGQFNNIGTIDNAVKIIDFYTEFFHHFTCFLVVRFNFTIVTEEFRKFSLFDHCRG